MPSAEMRNPIYFSRRRETKSDSKYPAYCAISVFFYS